MKFEYIRNTAGREKHPKHGEKVSRAERRKRERRLRKKRLDMTEHDPRAVKFHF